MTFRETLAVYRDRRIFWVFLAGCASGFPWVLIGSAMSGWLKDAGLTRAAIGLFGSVFAVYAINFLWAPFVDRVRIPVLSRLGQRRSWLAATQAGMLVLVVLLATVDPAAEIWLTSALALGVATLSATQDIAVDAYRIDHFANAPTEVLPAASGIAVIGWWTGNSLPGYLAFSQADAIGWGNVYWLLAGVTAVLLATTLFVLREPQTDREARQAEADARYERAIGGGHRAFRWLMVTVAEPLVDFFRRNGLKTALVLLLFVFLFKIGEAFLGRMAIVFYKEVGFSNAQVADYTKMLGWVTTVVFTLLGSMLNVRLGVVVGLLVGGTAMAASNLMFAWIAIAGPKEWLFAATVIVDNFTTAFSTVAFVSLLTALTGTAFSATQYALLASIGNLGRTVLASGSGVLVDALGSWAVFFVLTALMVIPGLVLLVIVRHRIPRLNTR